MALIYIMVPSEQVKKAEVRDQTSGVRERLGIGVVGCEILRVQKSDVRGQGLEVRGDG
jgi:hypothetical protein